METLPGKVWKEDVLFLLTAAWNSSPRKVGESYSVVNFSGSRNGWNVPSTMICWDLIDFNDGWIWCDLGAGFKYLLFSSQKKGGKMTSLTSIFFFRWMVQPLVTSWLGNLWDFCHTPEPQTFFMKSWRYVSFGKLVVNDRKLSHLYKISRKSGSSSFQGVCWSEQTCCPQVFVQPKGRTGKSVWEIQGD